MSERTDFKVGDRVRVCWPGHWDDGLVGRIVDVSGPDGWLVRLSTSHPTVRAMYMDGHYPADRLRHEEGADADAT